VNICTHDQLNTTFQDCDTFIGDVYISYNWTGQFGLPTLANTTSGLWATSTGCSDAGWGDPGFIWNAGIPGLTYISAIHLISLGSLRLYNTNLLQSLSLPRVESIDTLEIEYATSLQSISLPRLESIRMIQVYDSAVGTELDFPLLVNASDVGIGGIIASYVNHSSLLYPAYVRFSIFPLLASVDSEFQISSSSAGGIDWYNVAESGGSPTYPLMEINLPSLQVANSMSLTSSISRWDSSLSPYLSF
jgi:hypothetical protein